MVFRDLGSSPRNTMNCCGNLGMSLLALSLSFLLRAEASLWMLGGRNCVQFIGELPLSAPVVSLWRCGCFWGHVLWQDGSHSLWRIMNIKITQDYQTTASTTTARKCHVQSGYSACAYYGNALGSVVGKKDLKNSGLYKIEVYLSAAIL